MSDEYLSEMRAEMSRALEGLDAQLTRVRTGRASPQLVEGVNVNVTAYGAVMPVNQLATISAPDARLIVINPWDKSTIADIEKAITNSDLGLNPSNDGQVVRVPVPALTGERREQLVRQVRKLGEEAKVRVRNVRREYRDLFAGMLADKDISEDDLNRLNDKVQEATDGAVARIDERARSKEAEIQEI